MNAIIIDKSRLTNGNHLEEVKKEMKRQGWTAVTICDLPDGSLKMKCDDTSRVQSEDNS